MTSIEWLIHQYIKDGVLTKEIYEQALEMEKQQIMDAYIDRMDCTDKEEMRRILGGQYYQEKFGLKK